MAKKRLLIMSHDYTLTGAPIVLMHLALELVRDHELLVVSFADGPMRTQLLERGVNALVVPRLREDANITGSLLLSYDMLIANTLMGFVPIHAAFQMKKPSIWYLHEGHVGGMLMQRFAPWMANALPMATRLVTPCRFTTNLYSPLRSGPLDIIPYGTALQAEASLPTDISSAEPFRILQLGSIEPRKGQDVALAAMKLLTDLPVTLDIVGGVQDPGYQQQIAMASAADPRIKLHGELTIQKTQKMVSACDVLIAPSRDEVTPVVILEAMAWAKPVIASSVGGVPEMMQDGKSGFLFASGDSAALARLVSLLGSNPNLRREVGENARAFVRERRTLEQFGNRFRALVTEILPK